MTILGLIFITSSVRNLFQEILWNSPFGIIMLFHTCTFQHLQHYMEEFQSIHHCLSLFITKFGFTYLEYQFCCIKKTGKQSYHYVLSGTLGIIIGGLWPYIVGSFPEVALSNGEEVWKGLSTMGSWLVVVQIKPPC
jgi:hypothetical protein